jgi:hypothetical protein
MAGKEMKRQGKFESCLRRPAAPPTRSMPEDRYCEIGGKIMVRAPIVNKLRSTYPHKQACLKAMGNAKRTAAQVFCNRTFYHSHDRITLPLKWYAMTAFHRGFGEKCIYSLYGQDIFVRHDQR